MDLNLFPLYEGSILSGCLKFASSELQVLGTLKVFRQKQVSITSNFRFIKFSLY